MQHLPPPIAAGSGLVSGRPLASRFLLGFLIGVLATVSGLSVSGLSAADPTDSDGNRDGTTVDYVRDIKPLLATRCYACHGALKAKSGLRLDTQAFMVAGGDQGPAVIPGDVTNSHVWQRVSSADIAHRMPPESEGEPLTAPQLELLRSWITAGAPAPQDEQPEPSADQHWSFRACVRPPLPTIAQPTWAKNPIDRFIGLGHDRQGLSVSPEASRAVLIRRLFLDLIGVPPTLEQLTRWESDPSADWYESLVDRLLADPRHAERWGRHWMDIWRYADGSGLGSELRNSHTHIWHWRDWIVESLSADVSYAEMLRLMLAADELFPDDMQKLRATGYLARNYNRFSRTQWLEETIEHVGKGLLGMTFNCAKCHDHKYDPIEQVDYYRLRAFFEPYLVRVDMIQGEPNLDQGGIPRVYDAALSIPTYRFVRGQDSNPDTSTTIAPGVPSVLSLSEFSVTPISLPITASQPERRAAVLDTHIDAAQRNLRAAEDRASKIASASPTNGLAASDGQAERELAQLSVAVAHAELASVEHRADAMRATWAMEDATAETKQTATETARTRAHNAYRAERAVALAKARLQLAEATEQLKKATSEKREAEQQAVDKAREALTQAEQEPSEPSDKFAPFAGTARVETRFVSNQAPDPVEPFHTQTTGRRTALANWITDTRHPLTPRVAANHIWTRHMGSPLVATTFEFGRKGSPPSHPELLDWLARELIDSGWSMKHLHRLIVTSATYRMGPTTAGHERQMAKDPDNRWYWRRSPLRLESQVVRDSILAIAGQLDLTRGGRPIPADDQLASRRRSIYFLHSANDRNLFLTMFDDASAQECYRRDESIVPQQALALSNSQLVYNTARSIAEQISGSKQPSSHNELEFIQTLFRTVLMETPTAEESVICQKALAKWRSIPDVAKDPESELRCRSNLVRAMLNDNDFVTVR